MEQVGVCNKESNIFKDMIYRMDPGERGFLLIINLEEYNPIWNMNRSGSEVDVANLISTFKNFPFDIDACEGIKDEVKNKKWVVEKLKEVTQRKGYGCLVVVVMTHGSEDGWLCSYSDYFKVEDIWKPLQNYMIGKPKLIFIQACRGMDLSKSANADKEAEELYGIHTFPLPIPMDILIAFSSWEGCSSIRSEKMGSFFITELCKELTKHKERHILQIMTSVLQNLSMYNMTYEKEKQKVKQMPTFVYNLNKLVYLTNEILMK